MSELLTPKEVAAKLKITVAALNRFRMEHRGPHEGYKGVFERLCDDITQLVEELGNVRSKVFLLEQAINTHPLGILVYSKDGALTALEARLQMVEAHVLPGTLMNKQHIARMLGFTEESITKRLLEQKKEDATKT